MTMAPTRRTSIRIHPDRVRPAPLTHMAGARRDRTDRTLTTDVAAGPSRVTWAQDTGGTRTLATSGRVRTARLIRWGLLPTTQAPMPPVLRRVTTQEAAAVRTQARTAAGPSPQELGVTTPTRSTTEPNRCPVRRRAGLAPTPGRSAGQIPAPFPRTILRPFPRPERGRFGRPGT